MIGLVQGGKIMVKGFSRAKLISSSQPRTVLVRKGPETRNSTQGHPSLSTLPRNAQKCVLLISLKSIKPVKLTV